MKMILFLLAAGVMLATTHASHFRYGTMSWAPVPNRTNTIGLSIRIAYRANVYRRMRNEGEKFNTRFEGLEWAVGSSNKNSLGTMTVSSGGLFHGWTYAHGYLEHTYTQTFVDSQTNWRIRMSGCCRVGNMRANTHKYYTIETTVNKASFVNGHSGPTLDVFPILEVPRGQNTPLTLSGFSSVDGLIANGQLALKWANSAEMCRSSGSRCKNGPDYGVGVLNSQTGVAVWDTRFLRCGEVDDPQCLSSKFFTGRCIRGTACPHEAVPSYKWCQNLCDQYYHCRFISYQLSTQQCFLRRYRGRKKRKSGWVSCRANRKFRKPCLYPMQAIVTDSKGSSAAVDFLVKVVEPTLNKICTTTGFPCGPPEYCDHLGGGVCVDDPSPSFSTISSTQCTQAGTSVTCSILETEPLTLIITASDLNPNDRITLGASNVPPGAALSTDRNNAINHVQHTLSWTPLSTVVPPGAASQTFSTRLQLETADEPSTYMTVDITVLQRPSAPTNISFASMYSGSTAVGFNVNALTVVHSIPIVNENSYPATVIGYLITADPDPDDTGLHTYTLIDDANGRVALNDPHSGVVEVGATPTDYETSDFFSFSVSSCDPSSACIVATFNVIVADVNEPPTNIQLSAHTVSEHAPANTLIGEFFVDDPDVVPQSSTVAATNNCETNVLYNGPCLVGSCPIVGLVSSLSACKTFCETEVKCTALVYDGNSKTCTLKHARGRRNAVGASLNYTSCTGGRISGFDNNVFSIVSTTGSVNNNPAFAPFYLKGGELYSNGDLNYEKNATHHITVRACSRGVGRGVPTFLVSTLSVGVSAAAATLGNAGSNNQFDCTFKDIAISVLDENDPPTKIEFLDRSTQTVIAPHPAMDDIVPLVSLAENSVTGTVVSKIRTIDPDATSQTFTYEIIGAASSGYPFKLSTTSSTDDLTIHLVVNDSSVLDFESNGIRGMLFVRIRSSDASFSAPVATLAVRLTNIVEPPTVVSLSLHMKLTELSAPGTVAGAVDASADAYGVHPLRYTVASSGGNASSFLGIHSCSGNVYVLDNFAPAFSLPVGSEAQKVYYELNIDVMGESTVPATVRIELVMRSRAPIWANGGANVDIDLMESSVVDSIVVPTLLDTTGGGSSPDGVVDPNGDAPLYFSILSGNKGGLFRMSNATTGKIVVDRIGLNFESVRSYQLRIMVTDAVSKANAGGSGMVSYGTIVVNVVDENDAPFLEDNLSFEVAENSVAGTHVGHPIYYYDEDVVSGVPQEISFAFSSSTTTSGNVGPAFTVDSGQLVVAGTGGQVNLNLDFETIEVYTLGVVATDNGVPPMSSTTIVTIAVVDVNEAPTFNYVNTPVFSISEGAATGYLLRNGFKQYSITVGSHTFVHNHSKGVRVVQGTTEGLLSIALTGATTTDVVVTCANDQNFDTSANLVINSGGVNVDTVIQTQLVSSVYIPVQLENATVISAADLDDDSNLVYDIKLIKTGDASGFVVNRFTGAVEVAGALDFETAATYELLVRVVDNGGLSAEQYIIIHVEDENEAPTMPDSTVRYVNESATIGTYAAEAEISNGEIENTICASDPDAGVAGELLFAITSTDSPPFALVADGTVCFFVSVTASIDFESISHYPIAVRVTDKDASSPLYYDAKVEVVVVNINEAPILASATLNIRKYSAVLPAIGDHVGGQPLVAVDVDATETSMTYVIESQPNNHWSITGDPINPMIGHLTLATADPAVGTEILQVSVTDSFGTVSVSNAAITVTVVETNTAPDIICYANVTQNNANNVVDDTDCNFEMGEDAQLGTVAGTLGGVDAEGDGMTFSIVAGNELGVFQISQKTLALGTSEGSDPQGGSIIAEITLTSASSGKIDYEATDTTGKASFRLVVVCTDNNANSLYSGIVVDITITDQNEAPEIQGKWWWYYYYYYYYYYFSWNLHSFVTPSNPMKGGI